MLKTILVLPDGTEVSSGAGTVNAVQSCTLTECVNDSDELTLGSTCSNALEATLITPAGGLALDAGSEVVVHKESGGARQQIGVFTLEKPTRPTANTMKLIGYDRVSKLDKDLTAWLSGLTEWPYTLNTFAGMVCEACGLTFKVSDEPNGNFLVNQFTRSSVTGRQLMQWLGEICCRFCRADPFGEIEFAWYTDSGKAITPSGELYYFYNSLAYEDYTTDEIETVQIRMADSENGALWPAAEDGVNSYIIAGNPILNLRITEDLVPVLANIKAALADVRYTPCKVSVPANLDIRAGNTVTVTDKNGKTFTAYVMTKTQAGQKDTLECTGSRRRDSTSAANNKTLAEKMAAAESQAALNAESTAKEAINAQTQEEVFLKLTNGGKLKGLYMKDGELYINASYILSGKIAAKFIDADNLVVGRFYALDPGGAGIAINDNGLRTTSADTANPLIELSHSWIQTPAYGYLEEMPYFDMFKTFYDRGLEDELYGGIVDGVHIDTDGIEFRTNIGNFSDYPTHSYDHTVDFGISRYGQVTGSLKVSTPTADTHAVNKKYVDDLIAALKAQLGL